MMLWEVEITNLGRDGECERIRHEFQMVSSGDPVRATSRGYLIEGEKLDRELAEKLANQLLIDSVVERGEIRSVEQLQDQSALTVLLKPGVMDPTAQSILLAAGDLNVPVEQVRTFRRYYVRPEAMVNSTKQQLTKLLANDAIEQCVSGPLKVEHLAVGRPYEFKLIHVPIRSLDDAALLKVSRDGQLALSIEEMKTIQAYFQGLGRDATDAELESIAQTWSEHCSHKTLKGEMSYTETIDGKTTTRHFKNLLKETVFGATVAIRKQLGDADWCVSVFSDNAGVVKFDDKHHLCFKVETHNRPSAIEPYGGANTGLGGVIRDVLGTSLGGSAVCNTDIFCFARPDFPNDQVPSGIIHPRRIARGVVAGVRDYGNRMGIPTVNGAIIYDDRYLANPLVFCGTVGLIPVGKEWKAAIAGDYIVSIGGRTGRDGIHGATFSSEGLHTESETISGGAVQIGNAIEEKKVTDVILQARDRGLYTAITDCGAGGFSSAVGEMAAELGAKVQLDKAPLKYAGLSYTEIWISESQERMVVSVPPAKWKELEKLCSDEGVEATILGEFEATNRLKLYYHDHLVADLDMHFLHDGRPNTVRQAEYTQGTLQTCPTEKTGIPAQDALVKILGSYSVCSKESVVRQYDHEVQSGSVIKPFVGAVNDGPGDASVVMPVLGSWQGFAVANGINPRYADLDPAAGAAAAIDEAVRNAVAVGADPSRIAILDNFCWGNVSDPAMLGALVRTAVTCHDVAIAYGTPFISGKDSLNNSFSGKDGTRITIPHTLLISAMGIVPDVRKCVSMDLKTPGNDLYIVGNTFDELGGSHWCMVNGYTGGTPPKVDLKLAPQIFKAVHKAILAGLIRSCHDCSEGGLAVAIAEMAFAGGVGADVTELKSLPGSSECTDNTRLFSESTTRFVIEATPGNATALANVFSGLPLLKIGTTVKEPRLRIAGSNGEWLVWAKLDELKEAWQKPLR